MPVLTRVPPPRRLGGGVSWPTFYDLQQSQMVVSLCNAFYVLRGSPLFAQQAAVMMELYFFRHVQVPTCWLG